MRKLYYCRDCGSMVLNVERVWAEVTHLDYSDPANRQSMKIDDRTASSRVSKWWCDHCFGTGEGAPPSFERANPPEVVVEWLRLNEFSLKLPVATNARKRALS